MLCPLLYPVLRARFVPACGHSISAWGIAAGGIVLSIFSVMTAGQHASRFVYSAPLHGALFMMSRRTGRRVHEGGFCASAHACERLATI